MANWLLAVYRNQLPHVVCYLKQELLKQEYLHNDEPLIQVLKEQEERIHRIPTCGFTAASKRRKTIRYFEYQLGWDGKYPEAFLKGYNGYIHTDAYSGYNGIPGIKRCLCYTHLRRAFVAALPKDVHPPDCPKTVYDRPSFSILYLILFLYSCLSPLHLLKHLSYDVLPPLLKSYFEFSDSPPASKPAEAILQLSQLFEIEAGLEGLTHDEKKKERLNYEKPLIEAFW